MLDPVNVLIARSRRALIRARVLQRLRHRRRPRLARLISGVVCILAGWMIVTGAVTAHGTDLRPSRNTDLISLLNSEKKRNTELVRQVTAARADVDRLTAERNKLPDVEARLDRAQQAAGTSPVTGPAVTVVLADAPANVQPEGVDPDLLVVHQQDIQAVVNALWHGGAEAMTIQGVRVVATTAIKCVGNVVVLHGIPYAPPYVITAIGDPHRLQASLGADSYIINYRAYADRFGMGYSVRSQPTVVLPGHQGRVELQYAHAASGRQPSPSASPTR